MTEGLDDAAKAAWDYVVPTLAGSGFTSNTVANLGWPNIGIYCDGGNRAQHRLFLIGSFSVSDAVLEQLKRVHWGFDARYVAGDGHLIRLREAAGPYAATHLVDDQIWDREAERARLVQLQRQGGSFDDPAIAEQLARLSRADEQMRSSPDLRCRAHVGQGRRCGLRVDARSERVHDLFSWLWQQGYRELSLQTFGELYRRVASAAGPM